MNAKEHHFKRRFLFSTMLCAGLAVSTTAFGEKLEWFRVKLPLDEIYSFQRGVALSHNSPEAVNAEMTDKEFRKLLAAAAKIPETIVPNCYLSQTNGFRLNPTTTNLPLNELKLVSRLVKTYVNQRNDGHTARYALASLKKASEPPVEEIDEFRIRFFKEFPEVPNEWLRNETPIPAPQRKSGAPAVKEFVIVDREIAWPYSVTLESRQDMSGFKRDAQEFAPKIKAKFEAALREAEETLKQQTNSRTMGYAAKLWSEMDAVLLKNYGIKRRSIYELNPNVHFD